MTWLCQRFSRATIAVAWDQSFAVKHDEHFYLSKPSNRVASPQSLGLPTLAYARYDGCIRSVDLGCRRMAISELQQLGRKVRGVCCTHLELGFEGLGCRVSVLELVFRVRV